MKLASQHKHVSSGSAKLAAFREAHKNDGDASTNKPTYAQTETTSAEKEKLLKQTRFNVNVNSLMNAGFTRTEAEDLAALYFDDTNVSIGKILENAPQNSTVKLSDGRVTTVDNAARMATSTVASTTPTSTKKLEASIDKLAAEYASKGIPKERFFQKVARDIRTEDMAVQRYLMKYSKTAAGVFGEMREISAKYIAEPLDAVSMLPAGVKYAVNNPSTILPQMAKGITGTASGIKEDFVTNPARATAGLIATVVIYHGIVKVGSKVSSRVPAPRTVINTISKVKVKGKVTPSVAKEIKVVERTTYSRLNTLANDYAKTLKKYDNTYTNVHVVRKGTPRYNKAIQEMRSTKTELKTIENKIRNVVDEKIEFEKAVNKLTGKSDSSLTYAGIQKAMGKMSPTEYKQFMQNVKSGKSVAEFGLTEKALQNVASIQKDFNISPKKTTTYQFERVYKPAEPTIKSYADPVSKVSKLEGELSMYCKLERSPAVKRAKVTTKVKSRQTVEEALGIKFELPRVEVANEIKAATKTKTKVGTSTKGLTRSKLNTATKVKTKTKTLVALKTQLQTNIKALTKTQTKLQTQLRTITRVKPTTKADARTKAAAIKSVKTLVQTVTKAISQQKTALKNVNAAINSMPPVPTMVKPAVRTRSRKQTVKRKSTARKYNPKKMTDKVATFKQLFG